MNPFTTRSGGFARSRPRFFSDNNNNNNKPIPVVLTDADFPEMSGCRVKKTEESLVYKRAK